MPITVPDLDADKGVHTSPDPRLVEHSPKDRSPYLESQGSILMANRIMIYVTRRSCESTCLDITRGLVGVTGEVNAWDYMWHSQGTVSI